MNNATNLQTLSDLENTNTLIVTLLPDEQRISGHSTLVPSRSG
jgi:hypothetical protein